VQRTVGSLRALALAAAVLATAVCRNARQRSTHETATDVASPPASTSWADWVYDVTPRASQVPPGQADIRRVISNNGTGIRTCHQRALPRDSSLTHGRIVVGVTIDPSGRVKGVRVDGPGSFRSLEPCIRETVSRWAFPPSPDEYGTEFSYVL
jgi:TonB family protein